MEIDDKHKQVLQYAVQAYYEDYLEMKKDKLEELEAMEESLSEMRAILALLGAELPKPDAKSIGTIEQSHVVPDKQNHVPVEGSTARDNNAIQSTVSCNFESSAPKSEKIEQSKESVEAEIVEDYNIMHPGDLKLMPFNYDKNSMQQYKMIFFQEFPDGRVVIEYNNSHYYTSKDAVIQIPYPFPVGYFSKENGWSSTVEQAFKTYRRYLAGEILPKEPDAYKCITKEDLVVDWFECDPSQGKKIKGYENCSVVELTDGRAMVLKDGGRYYTTKEKVMKLRYPVPKGYFDGVGLSSNAEIGIRAYRHYLATQTQESNGDSGNSTDQVPEVKEDETPKSNQEENQDTEKPRLEYFKEDSGFDYASVAPQHIGGSTVYRSKAGKLVVKRQGKNNRGELLLTKDQDIEKLMDYNEKDVDWVIRSLSAEKRNILRGYLKDLKELKAVTETRQ